MPLNFISLFSGIEAASMAWKPLGWNCLALAEIEPFPSAVLAYHYPDVPNLGDITKADWTQFKGKCDVVVGGPPCQAFSIAGLRNSLQDERGNLSLEYLKVVDTINPRWVITENVPGWLRTKDNAFGCFLAGLVGADTPLVSPLERGRWTDAGMVVGPKRAAAWRILDAQYFFLAQRRRRVFVVASPRNGGNPAAVLFERKSLSGNTPPVSERTFFTFDTGITSYGNASKNNILLGIDTARLVTPLEVERAFGFSDNHTKIPWRGKPSEQCPDGSRYKALGNSMAVPVIFWLGKRIQQVEDLINGKND